MTCALQKHCTAAVLRWQTTPLGFEPRKRDPKSPVIPFHHGVRKGGEYFIPTSILTLNYLSAAADAVVRRTNEANALHAVASLAVVGIGSHDTPVAVTLDSLLDVGDGRTEVANTEHLPGLRSGKTAASVEELHDL